MGEPVERGSLALLDDCRRQFTRLSPEQAHRAQAEGAIVVDLRTSEHRAASHHIVGALVIDLTVLPWRLDPGFSHRIPEATSWDQRYILVCRHGYSSSWAAATLRRMGLANVHDVIGGYEAWEAAGLPITDEPADVRP